MIYYAQLDANGICKAVVQVSGVMIEIQSLDESLLGKQYNEATGEFEEVTPSE